MEWLVFVIKFFAAFFFFGGPKRVVHRKSLEKPRTRKREKIILENYF